VKKKGLPSLVVRIAVINSSCPNFTRMARKYISIIEILRMFRIPYDLDLVSRSCDPDLAGQNPAYIY
jgi:hypothetical protein